MSDTYESAEAETAEATLPTETETELETETEAELETEAEQRPFEDFPLSEAVLQGIRARGYTHPTPVQARVLEPAIEGGDLIVRSKTGTGKTAAFGIPLLEKVPLKTGKVQVIVLCPTRELALQVATEIEALGGPKGVRVEAVYGGTSMQKQFDALAEGPEFVVGTPGRVLDHIGRGTLDLSGCMARVLDEADEMLSMGFLEDVTRILDQTPQDAQTLLFSATVSPDIERLIHAYASEPETILLSGDEYSVEGIANILYETREEYPKPRNLLYLVDMEDPPSALIFCNTRDDTAMVTAVLNRHGLDADFINSDLSQAERERAMGRIKRGELRFLVATDLAARGIDISDLTHVINYSLPEDPAIYMHRVGRTGRIGKTGTAISLVTGREIHTLKSLESKYGIDFDRRRLPDPEEARKHWAERHIRELKAAMQEEVFEAFIPLARELAGRSDGEFLVAYALKFFFSRHRREQAIAAGEAPPERRERKGRERRDDDRGGRRRRGEEREGRRGRRGEEREGRRERREGEGERPERRERRDGEGERPERRERRRRRDEAPAAEAATEEARAEAVEGEALEAEAAEGAEPVPATRLFVGLGTAQGLDDAQVKAAVADAAGADPMSIVSVDLQDTRSYLEAQDEDAARALLAAHGKTFALPSGEEVELRVEVARPRTQRRRGRGRPRGGRRS